MFHDQSDFPLRTVGKVVTQPATVGLAGVYQTFRCGKLVQASMEQSFDPGGALPARPAASWLQTLELLGKPVVAPE
ncbi:MAG: hypothetical protein O2983_09260 [Planctomycetota bacterium]|nr:hypothetical protein [Planctomycetota bacterium]MDA0918620.1 hypothetical protein [Planctomycetota bacterium]MDA1159784.1 hypothetical protein [Planctomycetota bacterium]